MRSGSPLAARTEPRVCNPPDAAVPRAAWESRERASQQRRDLAPRRLALRASPLDASPLEQGRRRARDHASTEEEPRPGPVVPSRPLGDGPRPREDLPEAPLHHGHHRRAADDPAVRGLEQRGVGGELARQLHLDAGTISASLRRLELQGLVSRTRSEGDARRVDVELTRRGKAFDVPAKNTAEDAVARALAKASPRDVASTQRLLEDIVAELARAHEAP
ncbi:MAG: MarR family transcriptional regulator [Polyangiaceae bacterium]